MSSVYKISQKYESEFKISYHTNLLQKREKEEKSYNYISLIF